MFNLSLYECTIQKRPSAHCKTPYVADGILDNILTQIHTPVLGYVIEIAMYWLLKM